MGINSQVVKKINSQMDKPEFLHVDEFHIAILCAKGSKSKSLKNEDSCGFVIPYPSQIALVVSDGLGGHEMGDRASQIVVNTLLGRNSKQRRPFKPSTMMSRMEKAHYRIQDLGVDAGATAVAAVIEKDSFWFYSVGDSMGLLLRKSGEIIYKTYEHSVVGFATEAGFIEEKEAKDHEQSHVILNSLGFSDSRMESSFKLAIQKEDICFLCSDGLTDLLTTEEIVKCLRHSNFETGIMDLYQMAMDLRVKENHFDDLTFIACLNK